MSINLAPELWLSIGEFSARQGLNSLSRTSKHLMNLLRPLLYRFVDLRSSHPSFGPLTKKALFLLKEDKKLAAYVQEIHVDDTCMDLSELGEGEPFLGALSNMSSLQTLKMHTCKYFTEDKDTHTPLLHILRNMKRLNSKFHIECWNPADEILGSDEIFSLQDIFGSEDTID